MHSHWQVTAELPSLRHLTFIVSLGNTAQDVGQLVAGMAALTQQFPPVQSPTSCALPAEWPLNSTGITGVGCLSPRQVFFAKTKPCTLADAVGQISAETVCAYPPGIPTLLPGDVITATAITSLQRILAAGGTLTGQQDPTLKTLKIVEQSENLTGQAV